MRKTMLHSHDVIVLQELLFVVGEERLKTLLYKSQRKVVSIQKAAV